MTQGVTLRFTLFKSCIGNCMGASLSRHPLGLAHAQHSFALHHSCALGVLGASSQCKGPSLHSAQRHLDMSRCTVLTHKLGRKWADSSKQLGCFSHCTWLAQEWQQLRLHDNDALLLSAVQPMQFAIIALLADDSLSLRTTPMCAKHYCSEASEADFSRSCHHSVM